MATKKSTPVAQSKQAFEPLVYADNTRHTCIVFSIDEDIVHYIPLSVAGFQIITEPKLLFMAERGPMADYPVKHAAKLYAGYACDFGATKAAIEKLVELSGCNSAVIETALAKSKSLLQKGAVPIVPVAKPPSGKAAKAVASVEKKQRELFKPTRTLTYVPSLKSTAGDVARNLIMEGKLTDAAIFKAVCKAEPTAKDHVKWYRGDLRRKGYMPPAEVLK